MSTGVCITAGICGVLFDLDGTIADTNEIILCSMLDTLEAMSGRPWQREQLMPHWGMRLRDQLTRVYPEIDLEVAVPFYRDSYTRYHTRLLAEVPGTRPVLEALRRRGLAVGVVTSKKRANARQTLVDLDFLALLDVLVAEEDTTRHKPAPEPLLYAAAQLAMEPADLIYVGDNPDDVTAARAAGMRSVAVAWSLRARDELIAALPDVILERSADLLALLS